MSPPSSSNPAGTGDGESFSKSDGGRGGGGGRRRSSGLAGIGAKISAFVRPPPIDTSNLIGAMGPSSPSPRGKSVATPPLAGFCGDGDDDGDGDGGGGNHGGQKSLKKKSKDPVVEAAAVVGTETITPTGFNSSPRARGRIPAASPSDTRDGGGGGGGDNRRERILPFRRPVAHPTSPNAVDPRRALGRSSPRARGGRTRRGSGSGGVVGVGVDSTDDARWASGKPLVAVRRGNNGVGRGAGDRKPLSGGTRRGGGKDINTRWNADPQRGPSHHHTGHVPRALASDKFTFDSGVSSVPSRGASSDEKSGGSNGGYGSVFSRPGVRSTAAVDASTATATDTAVAASAPAVAFTVVAGPTLQNKPPRESSPGRGLTRAMAQRSSILGAKGTGGNGGGEEEGYSSSGRSRSGTDSSDNAQSDRSSSSNSSSDGGSGNGTPAGSPGVKGGYPSSRQKLRRSEQQLDAWVATVPDAVREGSATSPASSAIPTSLGARDARFNAGSNVTSRS